MRNPAEKSVIVGAAVRIFVPLLLLFSLLILLLGHDRPGGGFIGGALAGATIALYAMVFTPQRARRVVRVDDRVLTGIGLLVALASGLPALVLGDPFLTAYWVELRGLGLDGVWVGTPLLFDVGVYLVVVGAILMMIFSLTEEG